MKPVFHMFLECVNNNAVYPRSIDLSNQKKLCEKASKTVERDPIFSGMHRIGTCYIKIK